MGGCPLSTRMNCRQFRHEHLEYLDGTLSDEATVSIGLHLGSCTECARFDSIVRRGLLVVWNLRAIEPSPDFLSRLRRRIEGERRRSKSLETPMVMGQEAPEGFMALSKSVMPAVGINAARTSLTAKGRWCALASVLPEPAVPVRFDREGSPARMLRVQSAPNATRGFASWPPSMPGAAEPSASSETLRLVK